MPALREIVAVAAAVTAFTGLVWLVRGELGMTWDEPYFFERQHDIRDWLVRLVGSAADRRAALARSGLERAWRVCRAVPDQHPPVPELLSLVTGVLFERVLGPLRAYRLSTVLVFATAAGVLWRLVRTRWRPLAAAAALGALIFDPRIFADAQQITADVDLGAFWFLAAVAFLHTCETGRAPWAVGVLAGVAIMCKATGVLVLPAMVLWAIVYRPRNGWRPIAWGVATVPATMLVLNPAWWPAPIFGMARWVRAFLAYPQKVPTYYLGRVYDSVTTFLPWHNTIVLTAVMVPVGLLALAGLGLVATVWDGLTRRRFFWFPPPLWGRARERGAGDVAQRAGVAPDPRPQPSPTGGEGGKQGSAAPAPVVPAQTDPLSDAAVAGWAAVNFLTLMGMRMLAFMPAHDGLRQLVPAFFFFAVLAGYGAAALRRWAGRTVATAAIVLGVGSAAWATLSIHPFELSYYNALIGGPRGAKAAGMETTYFWDTATQDVLDWMNAHLPHGARLLIFPPPNVRTFGWEQRWGRLRPDIVVLNLDGPVFRERLALMEEPAPCYMIFQMRQGLYLPRSPRETRFFARLAESPALFELKPARVGVRLLAIFDQAQFRAVARARE